MKVLLIVAMLAASSMGQSQNTVLVDYLLSLQYGIQNYYDSMSSTFRDFRNLLSGYLVQLNTAGVTEVTEALRSIISIRDETQTLIDSTTGSEECLSHSIANWQANLENSGSSISTCAGLAAIPIVNATEDVHNFIVEQSRVVFEAQNVILNVIAEVNTVTNPTGITPFALNQVDALYIQFYFQIIPELSTRLDVVMKLRETIPFQLHNCLNAAIIRLEDEALVLQNTLELC